MKILALAILMASLGTFQAAADSCPPVLLEYCMSGCADLGGWVVQPFESMEFAFARYVTLDELEKLSAFMVQPHEPGAGALLLRRERLSAPAPRPDPALPHWRIEEHTDPFSAGTAAMRVGGAIYKTNGGPSAYVMVWFDACPTDGRQRGVRR